MLVTVVEIPAVDVPEALVTKIRGLSRETIFGITVHLMDGSVRRLLITKDDVLFLVDGTMRVCFSEAQEVKQL